MREVTLSDEKFQKAVEIIRAGGIVAFPTETYYGLAVDIDNQEGIKALFRLKQRPVLKPILVLIHEQTQLNEIVEFIPSVYKDLMRCFWPGPMTLLFPAKMGRVSSLTGESGTIGVRMSPHPVAKQLCSKWGKPITATSANISGLEPAHDADMVRDMFGTDIDFILDGGRTPGKEGSTVVGFENGELILLRPGPIDFSKIIGMIGQSGGRK